MSTPPEVQDTRRSGFYSGQYERFGEDLAAEVRREVYGMDFGQQGWRSLGEHEILISCANDAKRQRAAFSERLAKRPPERLRAVG
jgi:hypothetical protein